eukprot:TRINITY_DN12298_c6_g3_i1.p1 TRINITY_DN12298_c6_g3~~TRINITY_DN12298_c6_g3_i1.p1  ORF type:complete len:516 (+),score=111.63 TRINITY_DN12298_c6_g3_i1:643-2190(+)
MSNAILIGLLLPAIVIAESEPSLDTHDGVVLITADDFQFQQSGMSETHSFAKTEAKISNVSNRLSNVINATARQLQSQIHTLNSSLINQLKATQDAVLNVVTRVEARINASLELLDDRIQKIEARVGLGEQDSSNAGSLPAMLAAAQTASQESLSLLNTTIFDAMSNQASELHSSVAKVKTDLTASITTMSSDARQHTDQIKDTLERKLSTGITSLNETMQERVTELNEDVMALEQANATTSGKIDKMLTGDLKFETLKFASDNSTMAKASRAWTLLPPNIISNSLMTDVDANSKPTGFVAHTYPGSAGVTLSFEAVHPYTLCFEGPYLPTKPSNAAASCEQATQSNPFYFGRYYKGPRAGRGGLGDGWGGIGNGKILKVWGSRTSDNRIWVKPPVVSRWLTNKVLFRAWIKIVKGAFRIATDVGITPTLTKTQTDAGPDGWLFVNQLVAKSHTVNQGGNRYALIFMALGPPETNLKGDFEFYIALPYFGNVEVDDSPAWVPSVTDMMRTNNYAG